MGYDFADRLIEMRRSHGFSQEGLARDLGVSRQAISKWERAESTPDISNLVALADIYGVSLDELVRNNPVIAPQQDESESHSGSTPEQEPPHNESSDTAAVPQVNAGTTPQIDAPPSSSNEPTLPPPSDNAIPIQPAVVVASTVSQPQVQQTYSQTTAPGSYESSTAAQPSAQPFIYQPSTGYSHPMGQTTNDQSYIPPSGSPQANPTPSPIASSTSFAQQKIKSPFRTFPYPVFIVLLYLIIGFVFGLWHPGWILFFTIPFYYWIVSVIEHDPEYIAHHDAHTK